MIEHANVHQGQRFGELVGNIPTETVLMTLAARGVSTGIDTKSLAVACAMSGEIRAKYAHAAEESPDISKSQKVQ